ncbi:MAG: septum formation initiator family protein [Bdellovibrionota bacterium]
MFFRRFLAPWMAAFALGFSLYQFGVSARQVRSLAAENRGIEARVEALEEKNRTLSDQVGRLQKDRDVIERLVREELGFVRAGELVYRFR